MKLIKSSTYLSFFCILFLAVLLEVSASTCYYVAKKESGNKYTPYFTYDLTIDYDNNIITNVAVTSPAYISELDKINTFNNMSKNNTPCSLEKIYSVYEIDKGKDSEGYDYEIHNFWLYDTPQGESDLEFELQNVKTETKVEESVDNENIKDEKEADAAQEGLTCEKLFMDSSGSYNSTYRFMKMTFSFMKYLAFALAFILSIIDFFQVIPQNDVKAIKKAASKACIRVVLAIAIYFIPIILNFILGLLGFTSSTCGIV